MLTSDQFDSFVEPIMRLYTDYETSVIEDIARRLKNLDFASAAWQVQRLSESGALYKDILKKLSKLTGQSEAAIKEILTRAGVKAIKFDDAIYKAAGLNPLPLNMSPAMVQALKAALDKTNGVINNLTQTTVLNAQQAFIKAADLAYYQVSTGAMSYDQAIKQAVKKLAADGLDVVDYASGHRDKIDVAMRRAVLTGVAQTANTLQMTRADELGSDLVAVSAHIGARNTGTGPENHEQWQGKIYSRSGTHPKYPDFVKSTGYGTGEGLGGWNCRHSFYPFFEGLSENAYSRKELNDYASKKVTYQGKEIDFYTATQYQRGIERKIREWKRQEAALKAARQDTTFESGKVKQWQSTMRDFIKQTGLDRQNVREQIIMSSGGTVAPVAPIAPIVPEPPIVNNTVSQKLTPIQNFENKISNQNYESAGVYSQDGNVIFEKDGSKDNVDFSEEELKLMKNSIITHNHPTELPFSVDDIRLFVYTGAKEIRAVTGKYIYSALNIGEIGIRENIIYRVYDNIFLEQTLKMVGATEEEILNSVWEVFSKEYGFEYKRTPR